MHWRKSIFVEAPRLRTASEQYRHHVTVARERRPVYGATIRLVKVGDVGTVIEQEFGHLIVALNQADKQTFSIEKKISSNKSNRDQRKIGQTDAQNWWSMTTGPIVTFTAAW